MEAAASPSDQAADLLQKLAIGSSSETVPKPSDKVAHVLNPADAAASLKQKSKTLPQTDANSGYFPNVYPSTAYSYAFDGYFQGNEWNSQSLYFTDAVKSSQGGSPIYHHGYSYVPYGTEIQHYLYPSPYYAHQDLGNRLYAPTQVGNSQSKGNNGPFNREAGFGFAPLITPTDSPHRVASLTNSHKISTSEGFGNAPGLLNQIYPSAPVYGQYRNSFSSGIVPFGYDQMSINHKPVGAFSKYRARYVNESAGGLNELNRGPRVKVQNIPSSENNEEMFPVISDKEEYNGEDFPDDFHDAKFFVIKSYSEDDVHKSIKYGMWASTGTGNKKLDAAYREAMEKPNQCPVFLFFSVNTSGQFVGMAEMVGPVDFDRTLEYWQQDKWQGCFPVKWHIIKDVQNSSLRHIKLSNNDNKPVTNSRDTQEVEFNEGIQILKIFKDAKVTSSILDDFKFYEDRERKMQEKKAKQDKSQKQIQDVILTEKCLHR